MKKKNPIKVIIVIAVIIGGIAALAVLYHQSSLPVDKTGSKDNQTSIDLNEESDNEKPSLDENGDDLKPVLVEEEKPKPEPVEVEKPKPGPDEIQLARLDDGLLILVNKLNYLDKSYIPEDLKAIAYFAKDRSAESRFMRAEAADHFNKMVVSAKEAGIDIVMTTAYRSYGFQSVLYNNYVAKYGQTEADKFSAKPGFSEHQTGLAVDVSAPSVGYALTNTFDQTVEWKWLMENATDFGFVLRYPKGKTDITGYMYEPWHFRYVGIETAKVITEEKITLEEYINR